jgi:hypothetical protein
VPRRSARQRGDVIAEFAVSGVALAIVIVALVQLGFWLYAQNVVVAAAQEGAAVAAREDGTAEDGSQRAQALLVASLGPSADRVTVRVQQDANQATADVSGSWPVMVLGPVVNAPVHASATLERERFRPGGL